MARDVVEEWSNLPTFNALWPIVLSLFDMFLTRCVLERNEPGKYGSVSDRATSSTKETGRTRRETLQYFVHTHKCVCTVRREVRRAGVERESVLFIGTQFSILYTFMYSPA